MKFKPRNDYVLVRIIDLGKSPGGIAIPEISIQGKKFVVEAVGPDVVGLKVGDSVLMIGTKGEDWALLPNSKDLCVIKQANIIMVYEEEN